MNKSEVFVIGLMSGTSLDGIDLVYVKFDKNNYQFFEILESKTVSYSYKWKQDLQNSINFSSEELEDLDVNYGKYLGYVVNDFIDEFDSYWQDKKMIYLDLYEKNENKPEIHKISSCSSIFKNIITNNVDETINKLEKLDIR